MGSINSKRVAVNTAMLYLRMVFIMAISLYSSRVLLQTLGVDDFGIFNLVGGIVTMLNVMTAALTNSINRFLTFELGRKDSSDMIKVFSTSINVMVILSVIVLIIGEILYCFVLSYLNIPESRLNAAGWVYQFSLFTFVINLISIPYNSLLISHEKMSVYAYISICDAILKLAIILSLSYINYDNLIVYGLLLFSESILVRVFYSIYCRHHYSESKFIYSFNKPLMRKMLSFAGWNFLGQGASIVTNSGLTILVNLFFDLTVNAARAIALQVNSAVTQFVNSFTMALSPQITKSYAEGNSDGMCKLVIYGAKLSYLLMLFLALPLCIECDYVIQLWLGDYPQYTILFVRFTIIIAAFNSYNNTLVSALHATAKLKHYMIVTSIVEFLILPVSSLLCYLMRTPECVYCVSLAIYLILIAIRLLIVGNLININLLSYIKEVYFRTLLVTIVSLVVPLVIILFYDMSFLRFVAVCLSSWCSICLFSYIIGLNKEERNAVVNFVKSKI